MTSSLHKFSMTSALHHCNERTSGRVAAHECVPLNGALCLGGVEPNGLLLAVVEGGTGTQEPRLKRLLSHFIS